MHAEGRWGKVGEGATSATNWRCKMVKWNLVKEDDGGQCWRGSSDFGVKVESMVRTVVAHDTAHLFVCEDMGGWVARAHLGDVDFLYASPLPHPTADAAKLEAESWDRSPEREWEHAVEKVLGVVRPERSRLARPKAAKNW